MRKLSDPLTKADKEWLKTWNRGPLVGAEGSGGGSVDSEAGIPDEDDEPTPDEDSGYEGERWTKKALIAEIESK